jgi:hypothetical protein
MNTNTEKVTINKSEYVYLCIVEAKLDYLEALGVDNWGNYGCQCDMLGETECIFCTEDEEKFLGLEK